MKHEYHEGLKAGENFVKLATAVLQAKKTTAPAESEPKKKKEQAPKPSGKKRG